MSADIDWSKAPADAQAYMPGSYEWLEGWWKKKGTQCYFCPIEQSDLGEWKSTYARPFDHPSLLMRPSDRGWTGQGLPPVGTSCEYFSKSFQRWLPVVMIGLFRGNPVLGCEETGAVGELDVVEYQLRPRRTPEQIAADEREKVVAPMLEVIKQAHYAMPNTGVAPSAKARTYAEALHDAGYRKQEPKP